MTSKLRGKTGGSGQKAGAVADARDVKPPRDITYQPPAPPATTVAIDLRSAPDASQGASLQARAASLRVTDKTTHEQALEFIRGAKQLERKIDEHWRTITRGVDTLKRNLLDLKAKDLAPVEAALRLATAVTVTYETAERDRQYREEQQRRREAEEAARVRREEELAAQEAEAARIEAQSPDLSDRERKFVNNILSGYDPTASAHYAGYKNAGDTGKKLMAMPKIADAIASRKAAAEIREQAAAVKEQPLDIVQAAPAESRLGKVAGTSSRMNYSMEVVDADKLFQAVVLNSVPREAFQANAPFLNQQARALKESFESAFPGCRLIKTPTIAG